VLVGVRISDALDRGRLQQHSLRRLVHRRLHRSRLIRRENLECRLSCLFIDVLEIGKLVDLGDVCDCQGDVGRELDVVF
jgi:hypothetical protein